MKKVFFLAACVCAFALVSCEQEEIDNEEEQKPTVEIKVNLTADTIFAEGKAAVAITLSEKAEKDVTVTLAVSTQKVQDIDLVPANALSFSKQSATIKAGATSDTVIVSLDVTKASNGQFAAIKIASVEGATIGTKSMVYILYQKEITLTYMQNWSIRLKSDQIYNLSDDPSAPYPVLLVDVVADSIKYFSLDAWTNDEILEYFDGSLEELVLYTEEEYQLYYATYGYDSFFSISDEYKYVYYYGAGNYYLIMVEFDEEANATGRIGVSLAQFPDDGGDGVAARRAPYAQPSKSFLTRHPRIRK